MAVKILVGVLIVLSLLVSSCYPELSVQQYDKLKEDLAELDVQRQELEEEVAALLEELANVEAKNAKTLAYVEFLGKLFSTQSSEKILTGEFDIESLVDARAELMSAAESLGDNQVIYYLGLMDRENESQTIGAYYKVLEYCRKNIKKNLE